MRGSYGNGGVHRAWIVVRAPSAGSIGRVTQVFQERRDSSKPFPCFEIEASALGGMSGGPIFDMDGRLRGLVCSSFQMADDESGPPVAHGTTLWPCVALPVAPAEHPGLTREARLRDLVKNGRVDAINHEHLNLPVGE